MRLRIHTCKARVTFSSSLWWLSWMTDRLSTPRSMVILNIEISRHGEITHTHLYQRCYYAAIMRNDGRPTICVRLCTRLTHDVGRRSRFLAPYRHGAARRARRGLLSTTVPEG